MTELAREPGWYRLGDHGWEPVPAAEAEAEVKAGGGWDLVCVDTMAAGVEVPLF